MIIFLPFSLRLSDLLLRRALHRGRGQEAACAGSAQGVPARLCALGRTTNEHTPCRMPCKTAGVAARQKQPQARRKPSEAVASWLPIKKYWTRSEAKCEES